MKNLAELNFEQLKRENQMLHELIIKILRAHCDLDRCDHWRSWDAIMALAMDTPTDGEFILDTKDAMDNDSRRGGV